MSDVTNYQGLSETLSRLGHPPGAAGFHGALCGALCVRAAPEVDPLRLLDADVAARSDEDTRALLCSERDRAEQALAATDASFDLMLPPDEQGLDKRTQALVAWCDGFLYGLASQETLDLQKASEEVREAVSDITQFTRATLEADDDTETEEAAFAELVEYLRVAVQLIHIELRGAPPRSDASPPSRMH